jgi:hypothetical protein
MRYDRFDRRLEADLRASRPQPRVDFAQALTDEVRTRGAEKRSPLGRVGLALALSGLIVVALASFGGIGYASSSASHAVKKAVKKQAAPQHVWIVEKPRTAAAAQYGPIACPPECPAVPISTATPPTSTPPGTKPFTPPTAKPKANPKSGVESATAKAKGKGTANKQGVAVAKVQQGAPKATSSQLPFTGVALWVPLAIGLLLIAFGVALRTRSRRRHSEAH